jgi:tRNA-dihydrouridine synthase A
MMDRTDRHCRFFLRQITRRTLLYTEMVSVGAVLFGERERALGFHPQERPLALQLGGSDPASLARSARIAQDWGYDEVNLNVGCPSDRVREGEFGVCLMARPERVAEAVAAMRAACRLPVTVKHRLGFDHLDRYEDLARFVETVAAAGCDRFIVHARKAWLSGLSPKENRHLPPLLHERVHRLKDEFSALVIETNGGITDLAEARRHLSRLDGVMIGRAAYDDPFLLATADQEFHGGGEPAPTRREVIQRLLPYAAELRQRDVFVSRLTRHVLGLFAGQPGARSFRRHLSERACLSGAGPEVLEEALAGVPAEILDRRPGGAGEAPLEPTPFLTSVKAVS